MAGRQFKRYRNLDGVLLLDKPLGISSNSALQKARSIFRAAKAGHTGSLDPLASGMLPICFGEATKFSSYLLDANKRYQAVCQLGVTTTTGDREGEVISEAEVRADAGAIEAVLATFRGPIEQVPPMFSAVKHEGKRLYELARQGKQVERKARQVEIFELELVGFQDNLLELDVLCSKGTYIRTLAEDIGDALGCGASLHSLRRTAVWPFDREDCWSLEQLQQLKDQDETQLDTVLLPVDTMLRDYPAVQLSLEHCRELAYGRQVAVTEAVDGFCRLQNSEIGFLGLGEINNEGYLAPRRMVDTERLLSKLSARIEGE